MVRALIAGQVKPIMPIVQDNHLMEMDSRCPARSSLSDSFQQQSESFIVVPHRRVNPETPKVRRRLRQDGDTRKRVRSLLTETNSPPCAKQTRNGLRTCRSNIPPKMIRYWRMSEVQPAFPQATPRKAILGTVPAPRVSAISQGCTIASSYPLELGKNREQGCRIAELKLEITVYGRSNLTATLMCVIIAITT